MSSSQTIEQQTGILVVDDEPRDLEAVSEVLGTAGNRIYTAVNATQALSIAREHSADIDFLITDIALPGLNGVELHRMLCDSVPNLCNVLFVSARSGAEVLRFYGLSISDPHFLPKPFSADDLLRRVQWLRESRHPLRLKVS